MRVNRSIPNATVIPELSYADPGAAAEWLCAAFGFTVRLRIGNHRVQMNAGDGAMVAVERPGAMGSILMRVDDVTAHHQRATGHGAKVIHPLQDYPYGERQYTAEDCGGHRWTFSQTLADVDPADWLR